MTEQPTPKTYTIENPILSESLYMLEYVWSNERAEWESVPAYDAPIHARRTPASITFTVPESPETVV